LRQVLLLVDTFSLHARYFFPLHFIKSLLQKKKLQLSSEFNHTQA
jgi:hypothetical protein